MLGRIIFKEKKEGVLERKSLSKVSAARLRDILTAANKVLSGTEQEVFRALLPEKPLLEDTDQDLYTWCCTKSSNAQTGNGATLPKTQVVEGVTTVMPITSVAYKAQRRLEVKAKRTLMKGIHNEHQLKFNSIKDAKLLLEAIKKRFGGN
ncbi:hypothetical protein Tco_0646987 [Tanacetum coccineum]